LPTLVGVDKFVSIYNSISERTRCVSLTANSRPVEATTKQINRTLIDICRQFITNEL